MITNAQYGFRFGVSTSDAISDLHREIMSNLEKKKKNNDDDGNKVCCTFLNLAKAFDTVDHSVLLKNLPCYDIRGVTFQLNESFLDNRKQFTVVKNVCSSSHNVTCVVPQESTLSPLLFIIHVNDQRWSRRPNVRGQSKGLKKIQWQGQGPTFRGQTFSTPRKECSRPRTKDTIFLNYIFKKPHISCENSGDLQKIKKRSSRKRPRSPKIFLFNE